MNHLIEHVYYLIQAFDVRRRALKRGETLVVITPNADSFGYRVPCNAGFHLDFPWILRIFWITTLGSRAEKGGLTARTLKTSARYAPQIHYVKPAYSACRKAASRNVGILDNFSKSKWTVFRIAVIAVGPDAGGESPLLATLGES